MRATAVWERVSSRVPPPTSSLSPSPPKPANELRRYHKVFVFHIDGENKTKPKKAPAKGKGKKKKRKDDEDALEDSDDGDYEGLEVDYMSDESR